MGLDVTFIQDTPEATAARLVPLLGELDRIEINLSSGLPIEQAVLRCMRLSHSYQEGWSGGKLLGVFGIGHPAPHGSPWLLATTNVQAHRTLFLRASRRWMKETSKSYTYLWNYVWTGHHEAIRWLEWLGFTIHPAQPHGPSGAPFHPFTRGVL